MLWRFGHAREYFFKMEADEMKRAFLDVWSRDQSTQTFGYSWLLLANWDGCHVGMLLCFCLRFPSFSAKYVFGLELCPMVPLSSHSYGCAGLHTC